MYKISATFLALTQFAEARREMVEFTWPKAKQVHKIKFKSFTNVSKTVSVLL